MSKRADDRPKVTTDPESLPPAENAAQDVWRLRRVIADEITAARINGAGPWVAADAIAKALDRAGYTVAPKVGALFPHKGMTPEQVKQWRERWEAAVRASQDHQEPAEAPHGTGAAQGADGGTAALSGPRYIVETNHCGQWLHGMEFDDLTEARDYAEYCRETYGQTRIIRITREVFE